MTSLEAALFDPACTSHAGPAGMSRKSLVSSFKCNTLNQVRCCDEKVQAFERGGTRGHHDRTS
ncbi:hypothetical protein, partial [Ralstonia pseudosolanacearum]|uniref:hypothetical protein n=1 Tax=Ralstonia pseudosolanacearum TaxID=1310165 RepID=UPI001E60B97C